MHLDVFAAAFLLFSFFFFALPVEGILIVYSSENKLPVLVDMTVGGFK